MKPRVFASAEWASAASITYLWSQHVDHSLDSISTQRFPATGSQRAGASALWESAGFWPVSFFNGVLIEFGRQSALRGTRKPAINTYSALWGLRRASLANGTPA